MGCVSVAVVVLFVCAPFASSAPLDEPCELVIPSGVSFEGELPLVTDYNDCYNMGCQNVCPIEGGFGYVFQVLNADAAGHLVLHGRSGWYRHGGSVERDVDWFIGTCGTLGRLDVVLDAECPLYLFQTTTTCTGVEALQEVVGGPCDSDGWSAYGGPGGPVWLEVMPTTYEATYGDGTEEFDYVMWITGLASGTQPVEVRTWGAVKALYE